MKKLSMGLVALAALVLVAGCGGGAPRSMVKADQIGSVAVVSLGVNNYKQFGTRGRIDQALIDDNVNLMLKQTEQLLAKRWTVKPAASFVGDSAFRKLSIGDVKPGLAAPTIKGHTLPSFTTNRKEIIRGVLQPETAKQLCSTLGVDAVVVVYSEWMTDTGKFIPTVKALTKNCFSMYGKDGGQIFFDRKDVRGANVIGGAFAGVYINEDTIGQWVNAYASGAKTVLSRHM